MENERVWAIYRNESGGLYALEYFETVEHMNHMAMYRMFKREKREFPIVMNDFCGCHKFDSEDSNFVEFRTLQEDKKPLSLEEKYPVKASEFSYGWISPDGNTYYCDAEDAYDCAREICQMIYNLAISKNFEFELLERDWIKIFQNGHQELAVFTTTYRISQNQLDVLEKSALMKYELIKQFAVKAKRI